ncbi:hypothetical protein MKW94_019014 [Papaver nudicaule]|uniref:E3 ubiquitin-protein ligase RMA n=1 Tax=Papaver nudicaule TaxID=74823 RepID=A0AA41UXT6_PAPNU|nr:hypothetical protein [Papaver nudicaule]
MDSESGESVSKAPKSPSDSGNDHGEGIHYFDCGICFGSPRDPVSTLCGHIFCWPCMYKWLRYLRNHSCSQECPVCKAPVQQEKLIRLKPITGIDFPSQPAGQRPETT